MTDTCWLGVLELRRQMDSGKLTSRELVQTLLDRIQTVDRDGPGLRSIIEINPEAVEIATQLDAVPIEARMRLHGIPVLIKDNIDTADRMKTTAGSLALESMGPREDAFVVQRLRAAGAVVLGKTNMSEWANFRSTRSSSGWSARGGQCRNPHILDRSPCGSSSGSAAAVAAGLAPVSLGTETDGSILCPGSMCGVVGIKPTVGLTSRTGVVPISHSQDTVGSFARSVEDAAVLLSAIAGADPEDPATVDARPADFLLPFEGTDTMDMDLTSLRIGVPRERFFGYNREVDAVAEKAVATMRRLGAEVVDPVTFPHLEEMKQSQAEINGLLYEFKSGIKRYLASRGGEGPRTLDELIEFNRTHATVEMPYFAQELFERAAAKGDLEEQEYLDARAEGQRIFRTEGLDALLADHRLDALLMPTTSPAFLVDLVNGDHFIGGSSKPAAVAGYPAITVPAGDVRGLPVGITLMGAAYSEPLLIRIAYAFEQATKAFRRPQFLPTLSL